MITEEGLQLLREVDSKYADLTPLKRAEATIQPESSDVRRSHQATTLPESTSLCFLGIVLTAIAFAA